MKRNESQLLQYIKNNFIVDKNDCHVWQRSCSSGRYAAVHYNNKHWRVTRLLWTLNHGEIKSGFVVMHKCDNTKCINLDHLKLGSQKENVADMYDKKRHPSQHITHCPQGHEYNLENTYFHHGKKSCRVCKKLKMRQKNGYNGFRKSKTDSSQFAGVSFDTTRKKWIARIKINEKYKHLGSFKTEIEAVNKIKEVKNDLNP